MLFPEVVIIRYGLFLDTHKHKFQLYTLLTFIWCKDWFQQGLEIKLLIKKHKYNYIISHLLHQMQ
jgi:hypothetical protein